MTHIEHGSQWGPWTLDSEVLALNLTRDSHLYQINLEDITDSAHMMDWIFQIQMKSWSTNEIMGELINAFQDIFRPQGSLCGGGHSKTINATAFLRKRLGQDVG